ncbi:MAG: type III-B CRISPR module RAMP protein Cmr6 [Desulfobacteraceae bacterium]
MAYYPLNSDLQDQMTHFDRGNFSLWYNKFIPLSSASQLDPCDNSGVKDKRINLYKNRYLDVSKNTALRDLLQKKHNYQIHLCNMFENSGYKTITIKAALLSPIIPGIGESHPSETSLVFDHTMGIPYIPASSIKGINRYSQAVDYVLETKESPFLDDDEDTPAEASLIPLFFGSQTNKGDIVFLDAYPVHIPELKEDIMNPHYPQYYGTDGSTTIRPPSDTENPKPIKFLAVKEGAEFVFRILYRTEKTDIYSKDQININEKIQNFFKRSLTEEGIGAKTSLGYGRFEIQGYEEPQELKDSFDNYLSEFLSEEERSQEKIKGFIKEVNEINKNQKFLIDSKFDDWQRDEKLKASQEIARAFLPLVKKKKSNKDFTKQYLVLKEILKIDESSENAGERSENTEKTSEKAINQESEKTQDKLTKKEPAAEKKMKQFIKKGTISKKDLKNLKEFRKSFPELYNEISKLPVK